MATRCKPLLDSDWPAITRLKTPNKSLDASGASVFRIIIGPAMRANIDARDDEGRSALFFADVGSKSFASLVAAGADIKAKDCQGNTILMQRVSCSPSVAEVEELLRLGVKPEVRNQAGESALDLAVSLGLLNVVERLKSSPAG